VPLRRVPATVGPFQKWALGEVKKAKLSDSATSSGARTFRKRRTRRRRRKKAKDA